MSANPQSNNARNATTRLLNQRLAGMLGALMVLFVGLAVLHVNGRLGLSLRFSSYDWLYDLSWFRPTSAPESDLLIVYLDEASHRDLHQPFNRPWDRALHAEMLNRLTADGSKMAIFDIVFSDPGPDPKADQQFEDAIRRNGRVILAADYNSNQHQSDGRVAIRETPLVLPQERFLKAAAGWGIAQLQPDEDFVVREHYHGPPDLNFASLSWAAAHALGLRAVEVPRSRLMERWLNYYGGPDNIPSVSYKMALEKPAGFFKNKVVFIGARPMTGMFRERRDEFRSPYTTWYREPVFIPAVEVHALMLMNLQRGDWLHRLAPAAEWLILLIASICFGYGLSQLRPTVAVCAAAAGLAASTLCAMLLFDFARFWFPWMVVVAAQIPAGLVWAFSFRSIEWYVLRRVLEQERREADARIHEQAALLDKAQDAIIVHDLEGRTTYWNPSAERLYGWTAEEVRYHKIEELLGQGRAEDFAAARESVLSCGEWFGELRQKTRTGQEVILGSRWTLVRDAAGQPHSILAINTDITEKKKLESQLLRAQRMESIGTLAGGIAHDLNNVLAPIVMAVQLLDGDETSGPRKRWLKTIETSAQRGAELVKQVLSFARGQEGKKVTIQLKHLIREMEKIMRETFPKSIEVKLNLAPNLRPLKGDATQLHQVLLNLCVNARDAMPDGGTLTIVAKEVLLDESSAKRILGGKPGAYISLTVSDTGTGIPPEIMDRVFEPFFTTKEQGKGTGLGLSTVLSILRNHDALLDVSSTVGVGTTFNILFPPAETSTHRPPAPTRSEDLTGHDQLVLVVEDEPLIRQMIEAVLMKGRYQVIMAENGERGVALFQEHSQRISAVIMDMMMPVMDGQKALLAMRQIKGDTKFILISGLMQANDIKEQTQEAQIEVMRKPFASAELLRALQRVAA